MNIIPRKQKNAGFWVDPFKELDRIHNEMNSLFNWSVGDAARQENLTYTASPSIDYSEDENSVTIKADLPGVDKKNIQVNVQEGVLTIDGERKDESNRKENGARLTERYYGRFYRQIELPNGVDDEKVSAEYKDGVLTLSLPKKEEVKPKQIRIDVK